MGGFGSKEWSEVYTNGSPGSPEDQANKDEETKGTKGKMRGFDPRSISDDVERTPIQVDKARPGLSQEAQETPTGVKTNIDRFKAAIDPRSPSGLPRTPILVQDKPEEVRKCKDEDLPNQEAVVAPTRGATKPVPPPVAKLNLDDDDQEEENEEVEEEAVEPEAKEKLNVEDAKEETQDEAIPEQIEDKEVEDMEAVPEETKEPSVEEVIVEHVDENKAPIETDVTPNAANARVSGLSLPRVMDISGDSDCRSPLLIENDVDVFKNKPKLSAKKSPPKKPRTPFGKRCDNVMTDEATQMMKDVSLLTSQETQLSSSAHEDSLVI